MAPFAYTLGSIGDSRILVNLQTYPKDELLFVHGDDANYGPIGTVGVKHIDTNRYLIPRGTRPTLIYDIDASGAFSNFADFVRWEFIYYFNCCSVPGVFTTPIPVPSADYNVKLVDMTGIFINGQPYLKRTLKIIHGEGNSNGPVGTIGIRFLNQERFLIPRGTDVTVIGNQDTGALFSDINDFLFWEDTIYNCCSSAGGAIGETEGIRKKILSGEVINGGRVVIVDTDELLYHFNMADPTHYSKIIGIAESGGSAPGVLIRVVQLGNSDEIGVSWVGGQVYYVGASGFPEPTPPSSGMRMKIGVGVSSNILFVDPKEYIKLL